MNREIWKEKPKETIPSFLIESHLAKYHSPEKDNCQGIGTFWGLQFSRFNWILTEFKEIQTKLNGLKKANG